MSDRVKLTIGFGIILLVDIGAIALGYKQGDMHIMKTLEAAAAIWK